MTDFKIQHNIPIPPAGRGNNKGIAETLRKMKVGDSVFMALTQNSANGSARAIFGSGNYRTRRENEGYRIWRIK